MQAVTRTRQLSLAESADVAARADKLPHDTERAMVSSFFNIYLLRRIFAITSGRFSP